MVVEATYIMPIRCDRAEDLDDLTNYLRQLSGYVEELIVVDGSPSEVFTVHAGRWGSFVAHIPPAPELWTPNGKVGGVLTGLSRASHEHVIIADDDVRYDQDTLTRVVTLLGDADVVRPQNYFDPLPWHARWDTARTLLNRVVGGDWPGTLGVRRSALEDTGGYDGGVLFENLELVRTIRASGGVETVPLDLFVRRRPPSARHFFSQRVRQAYDEFARPLRLGIFLALLPLTVLLSLRRCWSLLTFLAVAIMALAEWGRRRGGGRRVFPVISSLLAPLWLMERTLCSWLALGYRLLGGAHYRGSVLVRAATPMKELRRRHEKAPALRHQNVHIADADRYLSLSERSDFLPRNGRLESWAWLLHAI